MNQSIAKAPIFPDEAEQTIEAIQKGSVDALVVNGPRGPQIVMLQDADQPYRVLVERMSDGALTVGPDGHILYANRRLADLTGEDAQSLVGRRFTSLFDGPAPHAENTTTPCRLLSRGTSIPVAVWLSTIFMGGASVRLVTIADQTVHHRVEEAISAERFARSILEQSTEAIIVLAPNGRISHASLVAEEIAIAPPLGRAFSDVFPVRRQKDGLPVDRLDTLLATKPFHGVEVQLQHPRLGDRSFLLSAGPLLDDAKQPIGAIVTLTNITARKRAEEQQTILVAELNHRVKNILAVVQAVSAQTVRTSSSLDAFSGAFAGRIQALSVAHDVLTRTRWSGIGLGELLESVLSPHLGVDRDRITFAGPPVLLPARTVVPLSMAVHELATNASKYGALSCQRGHIAVDWSLGATESDTVCVQWREQGGPEIAAGAPKSGFGTTLIQRVIRHDLEGKVDMTFATSGLSSRMQFPLRTQTELNDLLGGAQH